MDYPGNFETPAFPAGRSIAVSRTMSIWTLIAFLIIIFLCGILLWSARSDRLEPFLISTNNETGEWTVVGHSSGILEYSKEHTMQESVIGNFARNWFNISENATDNDAVWQKCDRSVCADTGTIMIAAHKCALYCAMGDDLYSRFIYEALPDQHARSNAGEVWELDDASMKITPAGEISENGGTWQLNATIYSNINEIIEVRAFIKVARNKAYYPQTWGFYIADFNAYRMN